MDRRTLLFTLTQVGLAACAIYMASLVTLPWFSVLGLVVLSTSAIAAQVAPAKCFGLWKWAWVGSLPALAGLLIGTTRQVDDFFALLAGQIALMIFITANKPGADKTNSSWNLVGVTWGFLSTAIVLCFAYSKNLPATFCLGLAIGLFLLILCRIWFRPGVFGIQMINAFILALVLFPAADVIVRFKSRHDMSQNPERYYLYEAAKKNPGAYAFWRRYYSEQWLKMQRQVIMYDTNEFNVVCFRPDTSAPFFHSTITINHKGFRGAEIPDQKGNTYRIVALGESTTFGITLNREDRPWPEVLEEMIRERIHPARPVQVINAGTPAATLPGNLGRLTNEILALKPDMILSYHGFNGFRMLDRDLPPVAAKPGPDYKPRPLKLLADFEYALKLDRYKKHLMQKPSRDGPNPIHAMESDYAKAYRQLIQIARTNGIRLVLANYSMAVNARSDPELIQFFEQINPEVRNAIKANQAHTEIIGQLAKENPEVCLVDTQPTLDGRHENFIDLVHFTQPGRQHMAEMFFAAIRKTLEADLSATNNAKSN